VEGTSAVELTPDLLRPSIRRALWSVTGANRAKSKQPSDFSVGMLHDVLGLVGHEFHRWTDRHPLDRWPIAKTIASELLQLQFRSIYMPISLADGMANLLAAEPNWQIGDPACGIGALLLSVGDRGFRRDHPVLLFGSDRDTRLEEIARELLRFAGSELNVVLVNRSATDKLMLNGGISFGPIGTRLVDRFQLPSGHWTRNEDVFALTSLVSRIAPGGRVVFGTTKRFLFSRALAEYRRYLSEKCRVVAVIELPSRSLDSTAVAPALIVIENTTPGETLVARLEDDWPTQLSEKGDFYRAYISHLQRR
jgi:SAM-dependent methyltransferase